MWMMGCRDVSESFNAPKVLPHVPRPSSTLSTTTSSTSTSTSTTNAAATSNHPSYLSRIHGSDLLLLNHHFEQNKRDFSGPGLPTVVSSRWNPTPEQLQTLEELYRRGTRTPTADQIQHITAQLRRYGKIEGKNVFYWFQNHKARERQKRRRRSKSQEEHQYQHQQHQQPHNQSLENKESGSSRTNSETEQQAKNWGFSSTVGEESFSMQRAERIQFEEAQQVQQRRLVDRHATWQMMEQMMKLQKTSCPSTTTTTPSIFSLHNENLHIFEKPQGGNEEENEESTTLELFPVRKGGRQEEEERVADVEEKENELLNGSMNMSSTNATPQFFEFL